MKHLDLFTGILGFAYAAKNVWRDEYQLIACCEKDKYCQQLIRKRAPGVPIFDDIRTLTGSQIFEKIDIVTGGFPCQDVSISNSYGVGINGENSGLYKEMLRIICEIRPRIFVMENSSELLNRGFGDLLGEISKIGYNAFWECIPAYYVGAPHERDRLWIVAYSEKIGWEWGWNVGKEIKKKLTGLRARKIRTWRLSSPEFCRTTDGISHRVDRLGACGNALVSQIPKLIFEAIKKYENS